MKAAANNQLPEVLEILQNGRFEFAFRTAKEVVAYVKVSCELAADKAARENGNWKSDLATRFSEKSYLACMEAARGSVPCSAHWARICTRVTRRKP